MAIMMLVYRCFSRNSQDSNFMVQKSKNVQRYNGYKAYGVKLRRD